jgi:hypothetical protein
VFGELPLWEVAEPHIHNEYRESLLLTGRSKSNKDAAKKVLSSALSWGVESRAYQRWLPTNGARLVTGRRRRSNRVRGAMSADVCLPRSRCDEDVDRELDGGRRSFGRREGDRRFADARVIGDSLQGPGVDGIDVRHLHRDARRRHVVVRDDGHLGRAVCRLRHRHDPAHVHRHLEAEQVEEEVARVSGPIGLDVGYRPANGHAPCSIARPLIEWCRSYVLDRRGISESEHSGVRGG